MTWILAIKKKYDNFGLKTNSLSYTLKKKGWTKDFALAQQNRNYLVHTWNKVIRTEQIRVTSGNKDVELANLAHNHINIDIYPRDK